MARYKVLIKPSAVRELEKVQRQKDLQRLVERISSLAADPRPAGCEKLSGRVDKYRIRKGDYRILYSINDAESTVVVVKIGHRKDVYR